MNERLTQLHVEAARYAKELYPNDIIEWSMCMSEKFAELIVRECANMAESFHHHQYDFTGNLELHEFIKEHFGVEE